MEKNKRTVLVVAIAAIIVAAVFASFGLNLFGTTAEVHLPSPSGPQSSDPGGAHGDPQDYLRVEVTCDTVRDVVATLSRSERCTYTVQVTTFRPDGAEDTTQSTIRTIPGWTWTETALSAGFHRFTLSGGDRVYRWYSGDREAKSWSAGPNAADLEGAHIPTYEDVIRLPDTALRNAGYETYEGAACIYVETQEKERTTRYWVSVESGLLLAAEIEEGETLIYRMTAGEVTRLAADTVFTLPDGTEIGPDQA